MVAVLAPFDEAFWGYFKEVLKIQDVLYFEDSMHKSKFQGILYFNLALWIYRVGVTLSF